MKKIFIALFLTMMVLFAGCQLSAEKETEESIIAPIKVVTVEELLLENNTSKAATTKDYNYLNGICIKAVNKATIYLVDRGQKRPIPNPATFNNLFRSWKYYEVIDIYSIPTGPAITNGAILAKGINSAAVYLISNGQKRGITSPAVMDKYNFNWNKIQKINDLVVSYVPTGYAIY